MAAPLQEPSEALQAFAQKLEAGAFVEVRLKDGNKVKGNYIPSSDAVFRLQPKTKNSVPVRDFPFRDIKSIDRKHDGFWSPTKIVVAAGIAIAAIITVSQLGSAWGIRKPKDVNRMVLFYDSIKFPQSFPTNWSNDIADS